MLKIGKFFWMYVVILKGFVTDVVLFFRFDRLMQKQLAYMLGRQQIFFEFSDDVEEYDELIEIMFNVNFNNNFMVLVREVGSFQLNMYKLIFFGMIMDIYVFYIGNCLFLFYFLFLYFYCQWVNIGFGFFKKNLMNVFIRVIFL